ncbi:hypothetical protein Bcep1808_0447 [Burkholderia vietnamiensis G4]|uniref:Uncharacterized protein n=1 Tax=Burkholderia vietnamiensis (strain G4 / LMG 22486) TaxID=269482 RepID=A4JB06_BURVG|nr:hypothetical protein Bcep1808_0447 [Burkholderia vietnamiensis G4]
MTTFLGDRLGDSLTSDLSRGRCSHLEPCAQSCPPRHRPPRGRHLLDPVHSLNFDSRPTKLCVSCTHLTIISEMKLYEYTGILAKFRNFARMGPP